MKERASRGTLKAISWMEVVSVAMYSAKDHAFVVCAYKDNPYLDECISSLMAQEVPAKEICVATSTPSKYIADICESHNIPLYVNPERKGAADDWNFAVRQVLDKKLITIVHQDDVYDSKYLEKVLQGANRVSRPLIIFTDYYEIRDGKRAGSNLLLLIKRVMCFSWRFPVVQRSKWIRRVVLAFGYPICCPSVTYVKENLPIPLFDTRFTNSHDYYAAVAIAKRKGAFVYIPKKLLGHRIYPQSATSANIGSEIRAQEDFQILSEMWPRCIARVIAFFYRKAEKNNREQGETISVNSDVAVYKEEQ